MFGSIRKQVDETIKHDIETIIGKNTVIKGEISGNGNLRIDGLVEGSISSEGCVVIGEAGTVNGDIKANTLNVSGQVNGNADISGNLAIAASGQLIGDVKVGSFNIAQGGVFKGRSEMSTRTRSESVDD
ncbi:MAG: polymer-forming cytoskeletal protein [Selenomonadaceae bacterium]|nr:polymer-forming cytoskeletal protein [Selenomonadaceae bacterium]